MPALKSSPALERRARALIESFGTYVDGHVKSTLTNASRRAVANDVRNLHARVTSYREEAERILAEPAFVDLNASLQDDISAIAEEMAVAEAEIEDASHPDTIFAALDETSKVRHTASMPISRVTLADLHGRLQLERRGQK